MQYISQQIPSFVRKYYKAFFHALLICIVNVFWIVFSLESLHNLRDWILILLYNATYILIIYLNIYFVFDRFFLAGRFTGYALVSFLSFFLGTYILQGIYAPSWQAFYTSLSKTGFYTEAVVLLIQYISFTALGICYRLLKMYIEGEQKISELMHAGLKAELASLKNQVSPHFLFNTLNNLYVLTKTDPGKASETVLQLSGLMKYQLYECNHERVSMAREMDYIRSILYIEQLRKDKWTFDIQFPEAIPAHVHIEPLLFIALVENAIKHGTQKAESGHLAASLDVNDEVTCFTIKNTLPAIKETSVNTSEHIGLNNLQRRLEILYPGRHSLETRDTEGYYTAILILKQ